MKKSYEYACNGKRNKQATRGGVALSLPLQCLLPLILLLILSQHANAFSVNKSKLNSNLLFSAKNVKRGEKLQQLIKPNNECSHLSNHAHCGVHLASQRSSNDNTNTNENTNYSITDKLQSGYDTIDGYERFLYSEKQKKKNKEKDNSLRKKIISAANNADGDGEDDGYSDMMKKKKQRPLVKKILMAPFQVGMAITKRIKKNVPEPGTLILVRHGESEWNANKTFTVSFSSLFD